MVEYLPSKQAVASSSLVFRFFVAKNYEIRDENSTERSSVLSSSEERAECEVLLPSDEITMAKHADTFNASEQDNLATREF